MGAVSRGGGDRREEDEGKEGREGQKGGMTCKPLLNVLIGNEIKFCVTCVYLFEIRV